MEEFIKDITKLFMINNCCYHNNEDEKKNIIIKENDSKWKNYRGLIGIHSNEINKIYKDLEYNMEFKKDNNPKTPRRVPV
tara:strand:+ start:21043 stop:21282 length:240 start_codon:yes stop_codon:yes gene_type:complete